MMPKITRQNALRKILGTLAFSVPTMGGVFAEKEHSMNKPLRAPIPATGELLGRIGLGTYQTFNTTDPRAKQELTLILQRFADLGGSLIDSSPMYGYSESVIGELSHQIARREKLFLATKVWTSGESAGISQMNESFAKMKAKEIDLMQIHNLVDWKVHLRTLRKWKDEGRIRYIGITHYTPSAFSEMEKIIRLEKLDFIQIPYSMAETTGELSLIPRAADQGMAVIANEPFDAGALFRAVDGKTLPGWTQQLGISSWAQYFLKWILGNSNVQYAIPATSKLKHLEDNMQASIGLLPNAEQRKRMLAELRLL